MNNLAAVWQNLIVCGSPNATNTNPCGFSDLIVLLRACIDDLTVIATVLAVIACVVIGAILLTSSGDPGALKKVKGILWNVLIGYFWIIVAWLLVYTITTALLNSGYSIL